MRITKSNLRRIIRESSNEYGNPPPSRETNWRQFPDELDTGGM